MGEYIIVGAGLAGLSAAITLAKAGKTCRLVSAQPSERAQSVLAAGGINGALDTGGEMDTPALHYADTMKAGCDLADAEAVEGMTMAAPEILHGLRSLGVPFHTEDGQICQRYFGGQKNRRTAYARSSTGKAVMTALIDEARKYEVQGRIVRYSHHELFRLCTENETCTGIAVRDVFGGECFALYGPVLLCTGGLSGFFPGHTTGTTANTGSAAAAAFAAGVRFSNLEMIQFHPTTYAIAGKRCLLSEAARGEGGKLCIRRDGKLWYFMDEKYPAFGSLMPRDVVSREIAAVLADPACEGQVYLDMTMLSDTVWKNRLPDLRAELLHYLHLDAARELIPVEPGIHYFMGGIHTDKKHRTNLSHLYAAGECCSLYHGANRLGGNSMLGAIYGGRTAAQSMIEETVERLETPDPLDFETERPKVTQSVGGILYDCMGIIRTKTGLEAGLSALETLEWKEKLTTPETSRVMLAKAMVLSALKRTESRGAHFRADYPTRDPAQQAETIAERKEEIHVSFAKA